MPRYRLRLPTGPPKPPRRTADVIQHATSSWPPASCPKCGNTLLIVDDREAHCAARFAGCGRMIYHVSAGRPEPYRRYEFYLQDRSAAKAAKESRHA